MLSVDLVLSPASTTCHTSSELRGTGKVSGEEVQENDGPSGFHDREEPELLSSSSRLNTLTINPKTSSPFCHVQRLQVPINKRERGTQSPIQVKHQVPVVRAKFQGVCKSQWQEPKAVSHVHFKLTVLEGKLEEVYNSSIQQAGVQDDVMQCGLDQDVIINSCLFNRAGYVYSALSGTPAFFIYRGV